MADRKTPPLETLRDAIAEAMWKALSAPNLPAACSRLGLRDGDSSEAMGSKRKYVRSRIMGHSAQQLLALAQSIIVEYDVPELEDFVSELTTPKEHRVTDLTRRAILTTLNDAGELFGDISVLDGLAVMELDFTEASAYEFDATLQDDILRHYVRNSDWTNSELLQICGALTCSQRRLFALLEKVVAPISRRGEDQAKLVAALNQPLAADGFALDVIGTVSRHPLYAVRRIAAGVAGAPKNLIFAAINAKPDLYFADAVNNDIAIANDSDALIYDRMLSEDGLYWPALASWWQDREHLDSQENARKALYVRLRDAVWATASPGETAIFETYYAHFATKLGDKLPALVPQVYLHYDPRTAAQRGPNRVLARQRMDFLLLLPHGSRIVIEVDGKHHYARDDTASPAKYAEMASEDRRLCLQGYEVYRFGAAEFLDVEKVGGRFKVGAKSKELMVDFFEKLLARHADRRP